MTVTLWVSALSALPLVNDRLACSWEPAELVACSP